MDSYRLKRREDWGRRFWDDPMQHRRSKSDIECNREMDQKGHPNSCPTADFSGVEESGKAKCPFIFEYMKHISICPVCASKFPPLPDR